MPAPRDPPEASRPIDEHNVRRLERGEPDPHHGRDGLVKRHTDERRCRSQLSIEDGEHEADFKHDGHDGHQREER